MIAQDNDASTLNSDATRPPERSQLWLALHDPETQRLLAYSDGALFLAADDGERDAWARLGLAVARVDDLSDFTVDHLRELNRFRFFLTIRSPAELDACAQSTGAPKVAAKPALPINIVLVAPAVDAATFHWLPIERVMRPVHHVWTAEWKGGFDVGGVAVWAPAEEVLAQLKQAIGAAPGADFLSLIRWSLSRDLRLAEAVAYATPPANLAEAARALESARQRGVAEGALAPHRRAYLSRVEDELIAPLHEAGATCGDPVAGSLYHDLAELERLSHVGRTAYGGAGELTDEAAATQLRLITAKHKIIALLDRRSGNSRRRPR